MADVEKSSHCRKGSPTSLGWNRRHQRWIILGAILMLLLAFVHQTEEFSFGWGGGDDEVASKDSATDSLVKGRGAEKKFKFHKIERIETTDDDDDEEESEDEQANNDQSAENDKDDDDGNVDDDDDEEAEADEGDGDDEDEDEKDDYEFAKARTPRKFSDLKKQRQRKAKLSKYLEDDEGDNSKGSWWPSFLTTNFWGRAGDKGDQDKKTDSKGEKEEEEAGDSSSNRIIEWLSWFGERFTSGKEIEQKDDKKEESGSWLDYLDRWPFNRLFPIGEPAKTIKLPKIFSWPSKKSSKKKGSRHHDEDEEEEDEGDEEEADEDEEEEEESFSQQEFNFVLYRLPAFVVNPLRAQKHPNCHQQLVTFQEQLKAHKLWTLQSK